MSRPSQSARIEKLSAKVQEQIVSCPNEQSFEDGEPIWIFGCATPLQDLLENAEVPEDLQDEVIATLVCPRCNSPFESWQDVGTKYPFELHHESLLARSIGKFYEPLLQFREFLKNYPSLGAVHPVGRRILREVEGFPKIALLKQSWFRARVISTTSAPTVEEMGPPDSLNHRIPGGRFNHAEKSHWYLTSNASSAVAEITSMEESSAWVQEFSVPLIPDILDLRAYSPEDDRAFDQDVEPREYPLIAVALIFGDVLYHAQERGAESHPEYLVPRFVAEAAKFIGYAGVCHRSPRHCGENLVVFDSALSFQPIGAPQFVTLDDEAIRQRERLYIDAGFPCLLPDFNHMSHIP